MKRVKGNEEEMFNTLLVFTLSDTITNVDSFSMQQMFVDALLVWSLKKRVIFSDRI